MMRARSATAATNIKLRSRLIAKAPREMSEMEIFLDTDLDVSDSSFQYIPLVEGKGQLELVPPHVRAS